ncbi:MAG: class I SAM-dependent methyltransferase [Steroidobacteraceae bacterium]
MTSHEQQVLQQFDAQAGAYLHSAVHAAGPDLAHAVLTVAASVAPQATALDVGCGAGHLTFALAAVVAQVTAVDPSPGMLGTVAAAAAARGLPNVRTRQASAAALPFDDGEYAVTASRYSAHHWPDVPAALAEMRRVLRPDGHLLMVDILGGSTPLLDTHLQAAELLRDPSHVRDYTCSEWRALINTAGFEVLEARSWPVRLEFASWVQRMRTPAEDAAAIRRLQTGAPREVRDGLAIEADGSFTARVGLFWARVA